VFDLDIVSSPHAALYPEVKLWSSDMRTLAEYDENLVKPAILFADSIKLWSERIDMIDSNASRSFAVARMPMRTVYHYLAICYRRDPTEIDSLGLDPSMLISKEDAAVFFHARDSIPKDILTEFIETHESQIDEVADATLAVLRSRHIDLSSAALRSLRDEGILSVSGWANGDNDVWSLAWEDEDAFFNRSYLDLVLSLPRSRNAVLLEPGAAFYLSGPGSQLAPGDAHSANARGIEGGEDKLTPTSLAFGMIGRLPGLSEVSIPDLIEIRRDLQDYLTPFRAEAASMAEALSAESLEPEDLERVLTRQWHVKVNPILSELDHKVRRGDYPRNLLAAFSEDKTAIASSAASLVLASGTLVAGLSTLIPAVAAASVPFVKAWNDTLKARDDVTQNRLYFLYQAKERIRRLTGLS
jgi:hypothetical protein